MTLGRPAQTNAAALLQRLLSPLQRTQRDFRLLERIRRTQHVHRQTQARGALFQLVARAFAFAQRRQSAADFLLRRAPGDGVGGAVDAVEIVLARIERLLQPFDMAAALAKAERARRESDRISSCRPSLTVSGRASTIWSSASTIGCSRSGL